MSACVTGGATRAESVRAGLAEVPADAVVVLVHDAARPLLPEEVIERVLAPLSEGWDGAVPGLPSRTRSSAWRRDGDVRRDGVARRALVPAQTPQASRRSAVCAAAPRETGGDRPSDWRPPSLVEARGGA